MSSLGELRAEVWESGRSTTCGMTLGKILLGLPCGMTFGKVLLGLPKKLPL